MLDHAVHMLVKCMSVMNSSHFLGEETLKRVSRWKREQEVTAKNVMRWEGLETKERKKALQPDRPDGTRTRQEQWQHVWQDMDCIVITELF